MRKSAYIITLIAMLLPLGAWALGGSGTSASPYTISSADDLKEFADIVNGTNGKTRNVAACGKLTADINLGNAAWKAMGSSSYAYTGTFDGQGYKISGLSLTATAANAGLFGYVNGATIKNFSLAGSISSNSDNVGSVVGSADGATQIYNVYSSVNITMTAAKSHIGGIAGQLLQENSKVSEIKGCAYSGTMNLGSCSDSNGGIVGFCEKNANIEIEYCFFSGSMSTSVNSPNALGGILGYADDDGDSQNFQSLKYCFVSGTLSPNSGTYVGAIAGQPKGKVANTGIIANNNYVSGVAANALGNSKTSATSTPITISVTANANGSVSQSYVNPTSTTATQLQVVATPNAHYHFSSWTDSGAQTHNVGLTASVSLTASFAIDQHTITVKTNDSNMGTVSGGGTFDYNSTKTITATPKTHYHLKQWNDGNTSTSRQITVIEDKTYTATFAIDQHTITVQANNNNYGTVTGGGTFDYNSSKTITATPKAGYHFVKWNDGNTNASRSVTVSANATYTANFAAHTYGSAVWTWASDGKSASAKITCTACGNVLSGNATITSEVKTAATCTAKGTTTYTARVTLNNKEYSDTKDVVDIAALGHDFTSQTATDTYLKSAATCTADAVYYHKCSRCTSKGTSTWTNTDTATGHGHTKGYTPTYTWSDDIDVHTCSFTLKCLDCNANVVSNSSLTGTQTAHTDPTCTATGSTTYQVTGSYSNTKSVAYNENNSKTYTIPALGHDMTENARVDATCTTDGNEAYWTCGSDCCEGKLFKDKNGTEEWNEMPVLSALGHQLDANGACPVCGRNPEAKAVYANGTLTFYYDIIDHDGTIYALNTGNTSPGWSSVCSSIISVVFDPSFAAARPTSCYYWFSNCVNLSNITGIEYLNTEEVTSMNGMFRLCKIITSLNLSSFNTSKVTDLSSMFYRCEALTTLNVSGFNTNEVTTMNKMFTECYKLQSLDLSSFNTSKTSNMTEMFLYCNQLKSLTIGNFDMTAAANNCNYMFYLCYSNTLTLKSIPFLKDGTFNTQFEGKTVNLVLDENSVIYEGTNYLPTITNCNHYNQTTPVHVAATCTDDGYDAKECSYCQNEFDVVVSYALGHDMTAHAHVDATCTTDGNEAYWTCSRCLDKLFKDSNGAAEWDGMPVLAALGHDMTAHAHVDATCTISGNEAYWTCSRCDDKFFKDNNGAAEWDGMPVLAALGHNMTVHAHVDATCTTDGNEAYWTCSRCLDKLYKDAEGNALWDAMPVLAAAGHHYDTDGICEVCDDAPVMDGLNIEDGTAYTARASREVNTLIYTRHFHGSNWTTWYVPFDMELTDEICEQMDFSRINNVHQYDDDEDGIADRTIIESFRQKAGVTLKANYPYLVRAKILNGGIIIDLCFQDVTVAAAAENSIVCRSMDYCYTFTGTYKGMGDSGYENYSLFDDVDDNNWYHFTKLEPMRHYMTITSRDGGSAPQQADVKLQIIGDEDADGIVSIYSKEQQQMGTYDLMGRKINSNTKQPGLRIVNGKVVFVK